MKKERFDEVREYALKLSEVFDDVPASLVFESITFYVASYIAITSRDHKDANAMEMSSLFVGMFFDVLKGVLYYIEDGRAARKDK